MLPDEKPDIYADTMCVFQKSWDFDRECRCRAVFLLPLTVLYFLPAEDTDDIEDHMASMLIKGGRVLSPEDNLDGALDVRIEDGVIREIGPNLAGGRMKRSRRAEAWWRLVLLISTCIFESREARPQKLLKAAWPPPWREGLRRSHRCPTPSRL